MAQRQVTTRISQEAYSRVVKRCAERRISVYEYFRELLNKHPDIECQIKRRKTPPIKNPPKPPKPYPIPRTKEEQLLYTQNPEYLKTLEYLDKRKTRLELLSVEGSKNIEKLG